MEMSNSDMESKGEEIQEPQDALENDEDDYYEEDSAEEEAAEEEREEEEEEKKELPEWACAYCQNDNVNAVAQCMVCKKWFCNSYCRYGSHIIQHLILSEHKSIRLHPNGLQKEYGTLPFAASTIRHTRISLTWERSNLTRASARSFAETSASTNRA